MTSTVNAQASAPLRVEWNAPEACGTADDVERRIESEAGELLDDVPSASVHADVAPQDDGLRLRLRFSIGHVEGAREVQLESCERAIEVAAVLFALSLHQIGVEHARLTDEADPPPASVSPAMPLDRRRGLGLAAHASFIGSVGASSDPSLGFGLGLRMTRSDWALDVAFAGTSSDISRASDATDIDSKLSRTLGVVRLGYGMLVGGASLLPSLGMSIGEIRGTGVNVSSPRTAHRVWLAALIGTELIVPVVRSWSITIRVEAELPLHRTEFAIQGIGPVYQVSPVVLDLFLGAAWEIL